MKTARHGNLETVLSFLLCLVNFFDFYLDIKIKTQISESLSSKETKNAYQCLNLNGLNFNRRFKCQRTTKKIFSQFFVGIELMCSDWTKVFIFNSFTFFIFYFELCGFYRLYKNENKNYWKPLFIRDKRKRLSVSKPHDFGS